MVLTLVVLEALVIAGSGVHAWATEGRWPLVWLAWHLGPLWLAWRAGCRLLQRRAEAVASWSVERHERRHGDVVVIEPDDFPAPLVENSI